jgi:hypothetical protein
LQKLIAFMTFGKRTPSGYCGIERRRHQRRRINAPAYIGLPAGGIVSCTVTNFSLLGARLAVPSITLVPDEFELQMQRYVFLASVARCAAGVVDVRLKPKD